MLNISNNNNNNNKNTGQMQHFSDQNILTMSYFCLPLSFIYLL